MKKLILFLLMSCLGLWFSASRAIPCPSKAWSDPEKTAFKEALRGWLKTGLTFTEEIDCTKEVDFTVRCGRMLISSRNGTMITTSPKIGGRVLTESGIPPGWGEAEKNALPVNEIYFRSDHPDGWFIDLTPATDEEFFMDGEGDGGSSRHKPGNSRTGERRVKGTEYRRQYRKTRDNRDRPRFSARVI